MANKHPRVNILKPGGGVGGHCIAVDPYFIISKFPNESDIIKTARKINNYKPKWCIEKIKNTLSDFEHINGRAAKIAIMGLAFKPNIDDLRESPAKKIAHKIKDIVTVRTCSFVPCQLSVFVHGRLSDQP